MCFQQTQGHDSTASLKHAAVSEVLKGIRRTKGTAPACKSPLLVGQLKAALRDRREDLLVVRDRALLLVGFAGAFRRSELVSLNVPGSAFIVTDWRSLSGARRRTREGEGGKVVIPLRIEAHNVPCAPAEGVAGSPPATSERSIMD